MTYHTTVVIYNNTTQRLQIISVIGKKFSFDGGGAQNQLLMTLQGGQQSNHQRVQLTDMAGRAKNGQHGGITLTIQFEDGGILKFQYNQCYALQKSYPQYGYRLNYAQLQHKSKRQHHVDIFPGGPHRGISSGHKGSVTITISQTINQTEQVHQTEQAHQKLAQLERVAAQDININKKKGQKATNKSVAEKLNEQGLDLMRQEEFMKAIKKFNKAYQESGKSEYMANVAKCYNQLGKPKKALEAAQEALQCNPDDEKAIKQKKIAKRQIKELKYQKEEQFDVRGQEQAEAGNHLQAYQNFNKAYKLTNNPFYLQKAKRSQQVLQKQQQLSYLMQRGQNFIQNSQFKQAIQVFNRALVVSPQHDAARHFKNQAQNYLNLQSASQLSIQGYQFYQKGQFQKAAANFKEAIKLCPNNQQFKKNLKLVQNVDQLIKEGNSLQQKKDFINSKECFLKALASNPNDKTIQIRINQLNLKILNQIGDKDTAKSLHMEGRELFSRGQYLKSFKKLSQAINLNPNNQLLKKDLAAAKASSEKVQNAQRIRQQGNFFLKNKQFQKALQKFNKIITQYSKLTQQVKLAQEGIKSIQGFKNIQKAKKLHLQGRELNSRGQYLKSFKKLSQAFNLNPNNQLIKKDLAAAKAFIERAQEAQYIRLQGNLFLTQKQFQKALQKFNQLIRQYSDINQQVKLAKEGIKSIQGFKNIQKAKKLHLQGRELISRGQYSNAFAKINQAFNLNPNNQLIKKDLAAAKAFIERAQDAQIIRLQGNFFLTEKQFQKALQKFNQLIRQYSDINLQVKLAKEGIKSIEAIQNKQKAKKIHLQGRELFSRGQFVNAFAKISQAFNLNPNDQVIKKDLATVQASLEKVQNAQRIRLQGNAFIRSSQFQKALEKYNEALTLNPKNEQILLNINNAKSYILNAEGQAFYQLSQFQNANKKFKQAASLNPSNETMQKNFTFTSQILAKQAAASQLLTEGELLIKNNQHEKAIEKLNQIILQYSDVKQVSDKAKTILTGVQALFQVNKLSQQGENLLIQKQYANAIIKFNEALALNPTYQKNIIGLANAKKGLALVQATKLNLQGIQAFNKGQYANAQAKFNQAFILVPLQQTFKKNSQMAGERLNKIKLASSLNLQAVALNQKKQYQQAINKFKEALLLDPTNEQFKKNIQVVTNNLNIALANKINLQGIDLYQKGQYKNAISKFNQALQKCETEQIRKNLESATVFFKSLEANKELHTKIMRSVEICRLGVESFKKDAFQQAIRHFDDAIIMHNRPIYHSNKETVYLSQPTVDYKQALACARTALQLKFKDVLATLNVNADEKSNTNLNLQLLNQGLDTFYKGCMQQEEQNDSEAVNHLQACVNVLQKVDLKYKKIILEQYENIIKKYIEMKIYEHGHVLAAKCSLMFPEETKFKKLMTMIDEQNETDLRQFLSRQRIVYEKYQIMNEI